MGEAEAAAVAVPHCEGSGEGVAVEETLRLAQDCVAAAVSECRPAEGLPVAVTEGEPLLLLLPRALTEAPPRPLPVGAAVADAARLPVPTPGVAVTVRLCLALALAVASSPVADASPEALPSALLLEELQGESEAPLDSVPGTAGVKDAPVVQLAARVALAVRVASPPLAVAALLLLEDKVGTSVPEAEAVPPVPQALTEGLVRLWGETVA